MAVGVRTADLKKVYSVTPPRAVTGPTAKKFWSREKRKKVEVIALAGVSLEIEPGEIFGLLGPNGAGKSTTVGALTTRVRPTSGEAWVGKYNVWQDQVEAKRLIGVVQQKPNLDYALTGREILHFHGAYFGVPAV